MFRPLVAASAALLALSAPAYAGSRTEASTVYLTVSSADFTSFLSGLGYSDIEEVSDNVFALSTANGFKFLIALVVCDSSDTSSDPGCYGIEMFATWTIDAADIPDVTAAANTYNSTMSLAKSYVADDALTIQRYSITDGGVTRAHLESEVREFLAAANALADSVAETTGIDVPRPE